MLENIHAGKKDTKNLVSMKPDKVTINTPPAKIVEHSASMV